MEKKDKKNRQQQRWERRKNVLSKISDKTLLPQEILTSSCCITSVGQRELLIENYKSILEYQKEHLIILTGQGRVEISGKALEIIYYGKEEMKVRGRIEDIIYR